MEHVNIFIKAVFIENMIFAYFLGMCSYLAISKTVKNAVGLGYRRNICIRRFCSCLLSAGKLFAESRSFELVVGRLGNMWI